MWIESSVWFFVVYAWICCRSVECRFSNLRMLEELMET